MKNPPGAANYTPRAAIATMPDTIADIDYAPTKTPICGPGFTIRDLRAELRTARTRIAALEAREAALVAALDESINTEPDED